MSYKTEIKAYGESSYYNNGLRFATEEEAYSYAGELLSRWIGADMFRVTQSEDPVNYVFMDGHAQAIVQA